MDLEYSSTNLDDQATINNPSIDSKEELTNSHVFPSNLPTTRHPSGRGYEVFVGKLPRYCFEFELFPLFERCGQIYEMRLIMNFSDCNRGYAFITYANRDDAKHCIKELNNYETRPNHLIGACQSVDNCRLFVGVFEQFKPNSIERVKKLKDYGFVHIKQRDDAL
ncbi:unnamed protein product [Rotaria sordida]|uniref:RRM domain-containing protein n=1 Tax=Rotaria sordida TaxID=392033 RepID=A0A816H1G3_9BILA|nr:unnamed protein product [Rotaria sordida]CAF1680116.1 unnamed protein product [Rotaria sordida]